MSNRRTRSRLKTVGRIARGLRGARGGVAALLARPAAGAQQAAAADPEVVGTWNAIAQTTILAPAPNGAGKANAEGFLWVVQAAVYNAVNGITGEYELYEWNNGREGGRRPPQPPRHMAFSWSTSAAATSTQRDDRGEPGRGTRDVARADPGRRRQGGAFATANERPSGSSSCGSTTAATPRSSSTALGPGVWRPTPPAMAPFGAWLGQVDPLMLESSSQLRPGPPPRSAPTSTCGSSRRSATTA